MLSETDRSTANKLFAEPVSDGTRAEPSFALVQFAFVDCFSPGTSIQNAELKYVFVAWVVAVH